MGELTTLGDVIRRLASLDRNATIYAARPWKAESGAMVAVEPDASGAPEEASRPYLNYFLEVAVARDFLEDWEATLGSAPTDQERSTRLIRYAIEDA